MKSCKIKWEYIKQIMPMGYLSYETLMKDNGWLWCGNSMTKEGMLYLWKRKL